MDTRTDTRTQKSWTHTRTHKIRFAKRAYAHKNVDRNTYTRKNIYMNTHNSWTHTYKHKKPRYQAHINIRRETRAQGRKHRRTKDGRNKRRRGRRKRGGRGEEEEDEEDEEVNETKR